MAAAQAPDRVFVAPDGSEVRIRRDAYGAPHIRGESESAVFFAQGFAAAEDRLVQMEQFRRAALGRASEARLIGGSFVEIDEQTRTMYYTEAERRAQFRALPGDMQQMLEAYAAGVNLYLDSMAVNPARFKPFDIGFYEALGMNVEPWQPTHSIAVIQFFLRVFGEWGGQELTRLAELESKGQAWFDVHRPINDPNVPTTIPSEPTSASRTASWTGPPVDPRVGIRWEEQGARRREWLREQEIPGKWGSFSIVINGSRSAEGGAMLFGAPQMGSIDENSTSPVHEVELWSPGLHVAGIGVAGMPGVIIGRTERHAWTLTSGYSDNRDVFIETTFDETMSQYRYDGSWYDFEVIVDTMIVAGNQRTFTHYRTIHGPVFERDLANRQVFSMKMTYWNRELDAVRGMVHLWSARNFAEFEEGARLMSLSFNLSYADVDGRITYWHVGRYPDRSDGVDPRLPRLGDGSQEWPGIFPFEELPQAADPPQGFFVNWNNKPVAWWDHGDNIPWAFENERDNEEAAGRVQYMIDALESTPGWTYEALQEFPRGMTETCIAEGRGALCSHNNMQGTYQQVLLFAEDGVTARNILPPGQSAFVSSASVSDPHRRDQWPLFRDFGFKEMEFIQETAVGRDVESPVSAAGGIAPYPNPTRGVFRIAVGELAGRPDAVEVFDMLGRRIVRQTLEPDALGRSTVDLGAVPSGAYVVVVLEEGEVRARGVVVRQ